MTKAISLSDEAYESLKSLKKGSESFSEIVLRLASSAKKKSLLDLAGRWAGGKEELDRIEKMIYKDRKKFKLRTVKF